RDDGIFEAGVVMNAAEHECARAIEAFFDDTLAVRAALEIAKAGFGLANHALVRRGGFLMPRLEVRRVDPEVREGRGPQNDVSAASGGDDLLRFDAEGQ